MVRSVHKTQVQLDRFDLQTGRGDSNPVIKRFNWLKETFERAFLVLGSPNPSICQSGTVNGHGSASLAKMAMMPPVLVPS
jgi:hypothetical protein